jgi:hypothetical protein
LSKLYEEKCCTWILEVFFFRFFTVLVHGVSDQLEVNECSFGHFLDVNLLEVMTEYNTQNIRRHLKKLLRCNSIFELINSKELIAKVVSLLVEVLLSEVVL